MKTISLNLKSKFNENQTSKYWRVIECNPQTVELKTWSTDHPVFYLKGIVLNSHDEKEIGEEKEILIQTYSFFLEAEVLSGKFTINN